MRQIEKEQKRSILATKENNEYEAFSEEIKINIAKGARIYIPELVEKLKKKYLPEDQLSENEIIERNRHIVRRIHDDWGGGRPWGDSAITQSMPDEIKNPNNYSRKNPEFARKNVANAQKAKIERQQLKKELHKVYKAIQNPSPEVIQEIKEEVKATVIEDTEPGIEIDEPMLRPLGEDHTIPFLSMTELNSAQYRLWVALTHKENWAHTSDDLQRDFIKPTRDKRKRFLAELQPHEQNGIKRRSEYLIALLQDVIETIEILQR